MFMILFKWQAKILNKIYKTQRYDKLATLQITNPEQINYSMLFQLTPGINTTDYTKIIQSTNKLCRPNTKANIMQQEVAYLDSFMKNLYQSKTIQANNLPVQQKKKQQQINSASTGVKKPLFGIQHVVVYSSLSKCRIWPKVLKSGIGFVPTLINFYNTFTKQYGDCLDFKFDPVILSQKYTKIMQKVNQKKRDHPKLISAIKNNNMQLITQLLDELQNKEKTKNVEQQQQVQLSGIINNIFQQGKAITHIACEYASINTIKYLASIGADFQLLDQEKQTALFYAVKRSDFQIVKYLIQQIKVNINHREYQQRTVLYLAAFQGDLQIVDYLYKNGANPQLCSKLDRTPLSKACYLGNITVVKYLLSINVDMLKQDNKGRTALHNAAWGVEGGRDGKRRGHIMLQDSPECVQLLISAGHPVDIQDYDGFTPLFSAVSSMGVKSLRVLIKYGGNLNHKTKNQQTAVFIAAKYGHVQMLKILIQQYKLNYTDVDFHGYTPLCASITLETNETFSYLCTLYMKNNVPMQIDKIIECCQQYQTTQCIKFIKMWMFQQKQDKDRIERVMYLSRSLEELAASLLKLKQKKAEIKEQIEGIMRAKNLMYRKNIDITQKQKEELQTMKIKQNEQKYRIFQKVMQKKLQQQQLTEDREKEKEKQKQIQNNTNNQNLKYSKNKELQTIRKLYNSLLDTTSYLVIELQKNIRSIINEMKVQSVKQRQSLVQQLRAKTISNYNQNQYRSIVIYLLSQCVQAFNKSKRIQISDIVTVMLQLAKAWDITHPSIPPHNMQNFSFDNKLSVNVHPAWLSEIKLSHNQSTHDILKLLTNKEVELNLTNNQHSLLDTMFKLAKYRQTAVIIGIFSKGESIGCLSYDNLLKAVTGNYINEQKGPNNESQNAQKQTLIQYCILHGISDIAVYLQQICNAPSTQSIVKIPQYQIKRIQLPMEETTIQLQPVDQWVLNLQQILTRMTEKQFSIYKKFIESKQHVQDNQIYEKQQQTKDKPLRLKEGETFQTCLNYSVVDTKTKLNDLEHALEKFVLIGIDVEHYNVSRQQCFICSIQISNGQAVYIIDPLNHLQTNHQADRFTPEDVGAFMRRLMSDQKKIKIYHAYENDVKWIHEDFNLYAFQFMENNTHRNRNVMDTSRIYGLINRSKKGQSVGLRKLCSLYLNYEMEKNFQRSDWRIRPLFKEMVQYAAIDAEVLPYVYLRILSVYKNNQTVFDKLKEGFCVKRNMKTRGVRNRLELLVENNGKNQRNKQKFE